jgi:hypothetical protein
MVSILSKIYRENIDNSQILNIYGILISKEFRKFLNLAANLSGVNFEGLGNKALKAFYLNVYQCMYLHNILLVWQDKTKL